MTDMIQLLSDRTLRVRRKEDRMFVSLHGAEYIYTHKYNNTMFVQLEPFASTPLIRANTDMVDLTVLDLSNDNSDDEIPAWIPIANQRYYRRINHHSGPEQVSFDIPPGINGPLRIIIQERGTVYGPEWERRVT
ncbi:hypothetical protein [Bacillus thuringiensis]|nr:hypothetical protein [Bacillus thuringiensis]